MLKNNKGQIIAVARGLSIIIVGIILFITLNVIFVGPDGSGGLFTVAEDDLNITGGEGNQTYQTIKVVWSVVPLALIIAGILYIIIYTQKEEPLPGYREGYY